MIKTRTLERALKDWKPWFKAVAHAYQDKESMRNTPEAWWSYTRSVLKRLRLPGKQMMCLYFISCVFSLDIDRGSYFFEDIKLPTFLHNKYDAFVECLKPTMWRTTVLEFLRERPPRQWPDFNVIGDRPNPPSVWNKADIQFILEWESQRWSPGESIAEKIRTYYSPCFIFLPSDHPLLQIGSKMKRRINDGIAIRCAHMKDNEGYTYAQIGKKFGWALQEDSYGNLTHCSTARIYVRRGRELSKK